MIAYHLWLVNDGQRDIARPSWLGARLQAKSSELIMDAPPVTSPAKPPLEDPLHEKEIFANEVTSIGSTRFDEQVGSNQPKAQRVIAARLILTNPAANQLLQSLQRLAAQSAGAQSATTKESN
jgi:hypothetical protein